MKSAVEQLAELEAAISAVLNAQEYDYNGKRVRRADLRVMYEEKRRLERQIVEDSGGNIAVAYFDRR